MFRKLATFGLAAGAALAVLFAADAGGSVFADERQDACKKAMNDRIQVCTDDCTAKALAAASDYVDTNHNVKFGCLKGCAIRQVMQMRNCPDGGAAHDVETNR